MDTRAAIEALLDKIYAARRQNNADAAAACFAENGRFMSNGAPAATTNRAEQVDALRGLFDAFELIEFEQHCRVIDPPRAAVYWRGQFRAKNGRVGDADILDIIEVRDGKIASLTTFYDTAYAAQLSA
jgi:ketosteroid isomerase-like protein